MTACWSAVEIRFDDKRRDFASRHLSMYSDGHPNDGGTGERTEMSRFADNLSRMAGMHAVSHEQLANC